MGNSFDQIILVALATYAVVNVLVNGSVFAERRAIIEAGGGNLAELITCAMCLGFWVALFLYINTICPLPVVQFLAAYGVFQLLDRFVPIKR